LVDNGILGDPYVDCGDNYIEVRFDTRNTFKGLVFVEDHLTEPECRSTPVEDDDPRGIFIVVSLIVAFHPEFLTKIDRVYVVQCFYMEMEKILEKEIQVKMSPPLLRTEQVPMPVCRYEVLDGSPTGPPIFYAAIGQMVYHKWSCETSTENQFCMTVHSCYVDDGNGDRVQLIDENGCARDKHLLQNLEYVSDLMVGKEAHVYKYADRQSMFFDCQITLTIKEPDQEFCEVPTCADPARRRRSETTLDEHSNSERQNGYSSDELKNLNQLNNNSLCYHFLLRYIIVLCNDFDDICMSSLGMGTVAMINLMMISTSAIFFYGAYKHALDKMQL
uniref:ZP domain-containing protein n=1 Tax=Anisakis simplex TaxID=6269 RepID=A0A0M3JR70_ANISI